MKKLFIVDYLPEAIEFIEKQNEKIRKKILYNISLAESTRDSNLLKKLSNEIWEFRTLYEKNYYRLFAFWDKKRKSFIVCTHGILKKTKKTPFKEIKKAEEIRRIYYQKNEL